MTLDKPKHQNVSLDTQIQNIITLKNKLINENIQLTTKIVNRQRKTDQWRTKRTENVKIMSIHDRDIKHLYGIRNAQELKQKYED